MIPALVGLILLLLLLSILLVAFAATRAGIGVAQHALVLPDELALERREQAGGVAAQGAEVPVLVGALEHVLPDAELEGAEGVDRLALRFGIFLRKRVFVRLYTL